MGYKLDTIKSYCSKCAPRGNTNKGEYHLYVEDVELGRYNEFECQVSPDHSNEHQALRARATLNVIGEIINFAKDKRRPALPFQFLRRGLNLSVPTTGFR